MSKYRVETTGGVYEIETEPQAHKTSPQIEVSSPSFLEEMNTVNPMSPSPVLNPLFNVLQKQYSSAREGLIESPALSQMTEGLSEKPANFLGIKLPSQRSVAKGAQGVGIDLLAGSVAGGINNLAPIAIKKTSEKLLIGDRIKSDVLKQIRSSFNSIPIKARNSFSDDLIRLNNEKIMLGKNPSISLKGMIDSIIADMGVDELKPSVERIISSVPQLQKMIKNPKLAENLTLKESQDLLNLIKSNLSNAKLSGVGNRPTDIPIYEDLINEITNSQLSVHPEFAATKKSFSDVMNQYKLVKGKIGAGLEKNILNKFGGSEANIAVENLLKNNQKALNEIKRFRKIYNAKKIAKLSVPYTAGTALGLKLLSE